MPDEDPYPKPSACPPSDPRDHTITQLTKILDFSTEVLVDRSNESHHHTVLIAEMAQELADLHGMLCSIANAYDHRDLLFNNDAECAKALATKARVGCRQLAPRPRR